MKTICVSILFLIYSVFSFAQTREKVITYYLSKHYEIDLSNKILELKKHLTKDEYIGFRIDNVEIEDSLFIFSMEPWVYTYQYGYIYGVSYYDNKGVFHFNESDQRLLLDSKRYVSVNEMLYPIWFGTDKYSAMGNYCRYHPDSFGQKDSLYHVYVNYSMRPDTLKILINLNNKEIRKSSDYVFKAQHYFVPEPNNEIIYALPDSLEAFFYSNINCKDKDVALLLTTVNDSSYIVSVMDCSRTTKLKDILNRLNRFVLINKSIYPLLFFSDFVLSPTIYNLQDDFIVCSSFIFNPKRIFGEHCIPPVLMVHNPPFIEQLKILNSTMEIRHNCKKTVR